MTATKAARSSGSTWTRSRGSTWLRSRTGARVVGIASSIAVIALVELLIIAGAINAFVVPKPTQILLAIPRIIAEENVLHRFWQTAQ